MPALQAELCDRVRALVARHQGTGFEDRTLRSHVSPRTRYPLVSCSRPMYFSKENFMAKPNKDSGQSKKKPQSPPADDMARNKQRQKAEVQEVAGRHKNQGQKDHKGRR
jgi:hypothetical protein